MKHFIPREKNYRQLFCYQKAEAIYDITCYFCDKYLNYRDRTVDQMKQAARSGKQNIVEGTAASITSKETEIKLINVAKASLQELLIDYEDYLRTHGLRIWEKGSVEQLKMCELGRVHNDSAYYMSLISTRPPETIANIAICLIWQTDVLLFRLLKRLEESFLQDGGLRENMMKCRVEERKNRRGI
ncbi:four helix bundle suffix domain-containing protein [Parabacteroides sp. PF5-6]|uniref:four helix bundle suffix domain-containing protein n=1 Tax=Parabacteroides sp. PF5-6 TaxID=1742403 RepID=UPI002404A53D|nr:four helix bundle suffix domain-containing protein [Parabacteroides sp. PF5-6]MDF9829050.1 four helix bundle suffix protein [Parabacteroides sp. PF5-6]